MRELLRFLQGHSNSSKRKQIWKRLRMIVAVVVVFTTTYSLILPVIALEQNRAAQMPGTDFGSGSIRVLDCGYEAHKHTDACYEERPVYDAEGVQTGTEKVLVCGKADWVVHTHDDACYENGALVCQLPENPEHIHTEDCYQTQKVLSCGLAESEDHRHTDSCYTEEKVLTCGQIEVHTHTDACYEKGHEGDSRFLICGKPELLVHQHGDECFTEVAQESAQEAAADEWASADADPAAVDTGSAATDAGLSEAENAGDAAGDGWAADGQAADGSDGFDAGTDSTFAEDPGVYGTDGANGSGDIYQGEGYADTADEAGNGGEDVIEPGTAGEDALDPGLTADGSDESVTGDGDAENSADQNVGIIANASREDATEQAESGEDADSTDGTTDKEDAGLAGNTTDKDTIEDLTIITDEDEEKSQAEEEKKKEDDKKEGDKKEDGKEFTRTVPVTGASISLQVTCGKESGIPEDAVFKATALSRYRADYDTYRDKAFAAVENYTDGENIRADKMPGLFDLSIFDADGNELQPEQPLTIAVELGSAPDADASGVYAVHFPGTDLDTVLTESASASNANANAIKNAGSKSSVPSMGAAAGSAEVIETTGEAGGTVSFEADSFSVYAIVYTVDFHWEVDGKEYSYSIAGGSAINLKDLLPLIGVISDDQETDLNELDCFMEAIKEVTFSDESLVKVAHPEEDITLKELKEKLGIEDDEEAFAIDEPDDALTGTETSLPNELETRYSFSTENTDGLVFGPPEAAVNASNDSLSNAETDTDADTSEELPNTEESELAVIDNDDTISAGSWVLISLKPFDTTETLTLTMKDSQEAVIVVTDKTGSNYDVWFDGTLGESRATNAYYSGAENRHVSVSDSANANIITLPSDSDFRHPTGYEYTLKGWYLVNPSNGEKQYYEAGATGVTITHDCVFYADWVPRTYDKGPASGKALVGDTPSTAGFVKTEMFDYNELFNAATNTQLKNITIGDQNAGHTETWQTNTNFTFISWNYYNNPNGTYYYLGYPANWQDSVLGDNNRYRGDTITTGIFNDDLKNKLFAPSNSTGKTYVGTGDYLFRYNAQTGEYYYDSDINAATYNQQDGRFYVYRDQELIADNDGVGRTNFLPYNDYPGGGVHAQNTGATNYWFGMKNTISFYLPDNVGTPQSKTNLVTYPQDPNNPEGPQVSANMQFKFSGDDDVWVYVDDELVLDLGGIHNRVGGIVDFSTGTVTKFKGTLGSKQNEVVDEEASAKLRSFLEGEHTLTVYYLERGSSLSNCSIYFNLQPQPKSLDLSKRVVGLTADELAKYQNQDFHYELVVNGKLYNSPEKANDTNEEIANKYKAIIYNKDGSEDSRRIIKDGQITIKHGQTIRIPYLNRFDTFYVAEQQWTNMDLFETPHAERVYHEDGTTIVHEEEVYLKPSHSHLEGNEAMVDWETYQYKLNDTEKVTFTNTLREKDLEVEKKWKDVPLADQEPVKFYVKATIPSGAEGAEPVEISVKALVDGQVKEITTGPHYTEFELSSGNSWKKMIEKLPATTNGGTPITYEVVEKDNGFVSKVETAEKNVCDVDVVKYWPDEKRAYWENNPGHEPEKIKFKLKNGSDEFYAGEDADGNPIFNAEGKWYQLDVTNNYVQRFRDLPANDDYTYYEPEDVDENENTTGLSVFKRSLIGSVIENSPMPKGKITVEKIWKNAGGQTIDNPPEGTEMKYEIYRVSHVHEWGEWKQTKPPTETEKGEEQRECLHEGCNETQTRELEVIGHNWVHDASKDQAVTCTEDGYEYWYCSNPHEDTVYEHRNIIRALGHDMDDGVQTKPPVLDQTTGRWTEGEITYTCRRAGCGYTEVVKFTPTNYFPGTDIPLQEDAMPSGVHDPNEMIAVKPSGIFKSGDKYYIIIKADSSHNWSGFGSDKGQSLVNFGLAIELDPNTIVKYDTNTFKQGNDYQGGKRNNMKKGNMYHDLATGTWYILKQDTGAKAPTEYSASENSPWYKIPGTGPAIPGDGTGANTGGNTPNPAPARRLLKVRRGAEANADLTTAVITDRLKELREKEGYKDASGTVHYYYTVEKLDNTEFSLPYQNEWKRTHDVDLKDENGNPYTYYVVETSPTSGWITTYKYEGGNVDGLKEDALKENGKTVTITNQQDQPPVSIDVFKVDAKKAADASDRFLSGAKFSLCDAEEHAISPLGSIKITNKETKVEITPENNLFEIPAAGVTITGLTNGTYKLIEHSAPAGYVITNNTTTFTVANGTVSEWSLTGTPGTTLEIPNPPGVELPHTGGPGTRLFTILGSILILGAGVLLWRRRRLI